MPIRILSVDDNPLLREGIAAILEDQPDMVLVSQASTSREAIQQHRSLKPDLTLMDLRLPDANGIDTLIAIRAESPEARVIVLTTFENDADNRRAMAAGASARTSSRACRRMNCCKRSEVRARARN